MEKDRKIVVTAACSTHLDKAKAKIESAIREGRANFGIVVEVPGSCQESRPKQAGYDKNFAQGWDAYMQRRTDIKQ